MNVYIFSVFLLLFAYFVIWKGVKLGKLDVRDSILWICLSIGMGVLVWRYEWLDWLAKLIGVNYPPALLFLLGFFVCLMFILDLTKRMNVLRQNHRILAQKIALMEMEEKERER